MARDIKKTEKYQQFAGPKVVCHYCGDEPHCIESHMDPEDRLLWYLLRFIGKHVCKDCSLPGPSAPRPAWDFL
ncbi:hypothetical protein VMCG_09377 [Cytospora schulzeri]|uniref:Uncharacterized protein n=1 Tax=Cytospora schulzeri TaxID=448051 RepID=A0A423VIE2_9PEZI|nr:hypothetical protein VMCG_09377 [Valsa malicola]